MNKTATILNERPEGMSMEEYRFIRKSQQKEIKNYLKGDIVFVSKKFGQKKGISAQRITESKK